jgi:GNAT superfamily N-acetyltransferase
MNYVVRHIKRDEWPLLEGFLYEAIFVPEGFEGEVPRSVIYDDPKCRAAFEGFGSRPDDRAVVAEVDGNVVGACWVRTTDEYGHIDDETPSFSISLYKPYRGHDLGTAMMKTMLDDLRDAGYARASLSVQKENPALRLYERMGFRIVGDGFDETEWLMVCRLDHATALQVRRLGPSDAPGLVEMRVAQLLEEGARESVDLRPALSDYYARHLADGTFVSRAALAEGRMVASSGISIVERPPYFGCPTGRIGLVSGMYTLPTWRRQGIARDLLCRVVDEARAQGCGAVHITASDAGVPLYRSVGFVHNDSFLQLSL